MATAAQITANQANAQKSTGPRTESGKAKSKLNRFSHGFTSNSLLPKAEKMNEYCDLIEALTLEFQPATTTEQILVEAMAKNQWLCLRSFRMQTELLNQESDDKLKDLGLLIRYHSTAERSFHKAHNELVKAQKERKNSGIGFESQKPAEPVENATETTPETPGQPPSSSRTPFLNDPYSPQAMNLAGTLAKLAA
jgi:hypothetical protein